MEREVYTGFERRKFKRIKQQFTSKILIDAEAASAKWDIVLARNVGAEGILFNFGAELKAQTTLKLIINFPTIQNPISCMARVLRTKQIAKVPMYEIAAYFTLIEGGTKELINEAAENFYSKKLGRIES